MLAFGSLVMIVLLIAVASQVVSWYLLKTLSKEHYLKIYPRGYFDANRSTHFKAAKFLYYPVGWKEINSSKLRCWCNPPEKRQRF
jgi:isoprenylcysteine carboxyl methyltransferase (ICMT) family protein YpbQ